MLTRRSRLSFPILLVAILLSSGCPRTDGETGGSLSLSEVRDAPDLLPETVPSDGESRVDQWLADEMAETAIHPDVDGSSLVDSDAVEDGANAPDGLAQPDSDDVTCLPDCVGKECGSDGCGGECGKCPEVAPVCDTSGTCQFGCEPDCEEKECGGDGCDGSCGACEAGECVAGQCVDQCAESDCDEVGERQCVGDTSYQVCGAALPPCEESLSFGESKECLAGTLCVGGECLATSPCELAAKQGSHFGCAFWSVDLALYPDPYAEVKPDTAPHALYFAAPEGETATITLTTLAAGIDLAVTETTLCGGCSAALTLPVMSLVGAGIFDRSVYITADRPIAVAQVNPENAAAAANDASLLWPEHLLDTNYTILTWPTEPLEQMPMLGIPSQHGYFAVVATAPGTTDVSFTLPVTGKALTPGGGVLDAAVLHTVTLAQHEVLQVLADGSVKQDSYDLSGATVAASHPVSVFTGHEEAAVCHGSIDENCCADHLEAQLLPDPRWGHYYVCVKAPPRSPADADVWRVVAGNAGATLSTSPVVAGLHQVELAPGEWVEAATKLSFELVADQPVQVAQYLVGKECSGGGIGDPALIITVPKSGFAAQFFAPALPGYSTTQAVIVRPAGTTVKVAGAVVAAGFGPVGAGTYERAYVTVEEGSWISIASGGMAYLYGYSAVAGYGLPLGAAFGE